MKMFLCCAFIFFLHQPVQAATYRLHTVQSGDVWSVIRFTNLTDLHTVQSGDVWSVIRFTNLTDADGVIDITGFDNERERYGPVTLELDARVTVVLSSRELERGAPEKGLYDGLGDGSGGWQLELETDLEIGAMSFKSGLASDVLAVAEAVADTPPGGGLSSHFLRVHRLADRVPILFLSSGPLEGRRQRFEGRHELYSAYDWTLEEEVQGVEIGRGSYELYYSLNLWLKHGNKPNLKPWARYLGYLDYGLFAVMRGAIHGQFYNQAYIAGNSMGCAESESTEDRYGMNLPPEDAKWAGAAVMVTPDGRFGYGPVNLEVSAIIPPWEVTTEAKVGSSTSYYDAVAVLTITASAYDAEDPASVLAELPENGLVLGYVDENYGKYARLEAYGYRCEEIAGWIATHDGRGLDDNHWAFGARLVDED